MKIVQNVLFRPCAGRFDQIAFLNVSEPKIALRDRNSRQYVKTVGFPWKLYKTCFSGHAEDVFTKLHFLTFQSQKSLCRTENHANTWKSYKTCFLGDAEDVLAKSLISTIQIQKSPRRPKLTLIRENSRLSMKIAQNVLFRQCGGRFGQIVFFNVLDPKIALPDWNSRQYVKTVGFVWKLYRTCFWGHAEDVLTKSHFSTFQSQKSLYGTEIHANT